MAKIKTTYVCTNCGIQSPKWVGKCNACGEWNTYVEEIIEKSQTQEEKRRNWNKAGDKTIKEQKAVPLDQIEAGKVVRMKTADGEFNRAIGGGIVPGSVTLIGGAPGIGKSTLLLQLALQTRKKILYISGEESAEQIKLRADRLNGSAENCFILTETNTARIIQQAKQVAPALIIADSIQTLSSPHLESMPGTISQIRETAGELQRFAKTYNIPVIIIGHITKDGAIAGPKLLEHIVDTVLQFEGDRNHSYRILRTLKNRFGSTDMSGIYEMQREGLREVSNPSELLLSQRDEALSGSAIAATMEGLRPMLVEVQALVTKAVYGTPQRTATGFDMRRLSMLLAVLEKRGGLPFGQNDVFLNIAGGIKVDDPAMDLAIVAALISSLSDVSVPSDHCFAGEVGLSGEIRAVNRVEQRVQEAARLGFKTIFISKYNLKGLDISRYGIKVEAIAKVEEMYRKLFE